MEIILRCALKICDAVEVDDSIKVNSARIIFTFKHIYIHIHIYRVIHKSVKHFKNSQQIDYATDHGNFYVDRERNCLSHF